jgi:hypothetical protein
VSVSPLLGRLEVPLYFVFEEFHAHTACSSVNEQGNAIPRFFYLAGIGWARCIGIRIPAGDLNRLFFAIYWIFDAIQFPGRTDIPKNHIEALFGIGVGIDLDKHGHSPFKNELSYPYSAGRVKHKSFRWKEKGIKKPGAHAHPMTDFKKTKSISFTNSNNITVIDYMIF